MSHLTASTALRRGPRQAGFSLIELMIAIVIAMVVAAGAIAVFGNMRSTFTTQDKLGQLQDSQRLAMTILNTTVQSTGFFIRPQDQTYDGVFAAVATPANPDASTFGDKTAIVGVAGATSDTFNVRYEANVTSGLMNCLGQASTLPTVPTSTGTVVGTDVDMVMNSFAVTNNQLTCRVRKNSEAAWGNPVALVDNVSYMKVLYLVDKGATGTAYAYMSATEVAAGSHWPFVTAVRIRLKFLDPYKPGTELSNESVQTINLMSRS